MITGSVHATIIIAYAPTELAETPVKDAFHAALDSTLEALPSHRLTLVLGDLNARVGTTNDRWNDVIEGFGCPRPLTPSTPAKGAPGGSAARGRCPQQAVAVAAAATAAAAALIPAPSRPVAHQGGMPWARLGHFDLRPYQPPLLGLRA